MPEEGLFILNESEQVVLGHAVFCELAPLLDGERTLEDIFAALGDRHPPARVFQALAELRRHGYLGDGPSGVDEGAGAYQEALGLDTEMAGAALAAASVNVKSLGPIDGAPLIELLKSMALSVSPGDTAQASLQVVLTDDYLRGELDELNRRFLAAKEPWLLVKPLGLEIWVGPLFEPGQTGCWMCLSHRLRGLRKLERYLQHGRSAACPPGSIPSLPSTRQVAYGLAASEVARRLMCGIPGGGLTGKVLSFNTVSFEQGEHLLTRRPQCPACGQPVHADARKGRPIRLKPRPKGFTSDGGHREIPPEETVAQLRRHISPITGIVERLRPAADSAGLSLYVAEHAFGDAQVDPAFLRAALRRNAGGKGLTAPQAQASALGEAIERYSGVFQGDEPRFGATRRELGEAAIHPNACMGFSERQYRERERWNGRGSKVHHVPEPFDDSESVAWTPLWSLTASAPRYLPTAYCYYGAEVAGARFAIADSNGCAAGNNLEEAILQGFLELVERDAVAIWWFNRLSMPGVDLASFGDEAAAFALQHRRLGREISGLDLTSDLGIPTYAAISRRSAGPPEDILLGFGCHLEPRIALLRALTEVGQSLPAQPAAPGGGQPRHGGSDLLARSWWSTATVENQPYLRPKSDRPFLRCVDRPSLSSEDLQSDVGRCVAIAAAAGLETLVLDQTRPEVGLHVVRVVVPGLRHFWPRLDRGRLYDVPVAQGWRAERMNESEANPLVIYF